MATCGYRGLWLAALLLITLCVPVPAQETPATSSAETTSSDETTTPVESANEAPPTAEEGASDAQDERKPNLIEKYVLEPIGEEILRPIKEELLEIELPEPQERYKVEISVRPRIEDLVKNDYLRVPIRFKYGLLKNVELSLQPNTYLHNPALRGTLGAGMSTLDIGSKYRFQRILQDYVRMALSFHIIYPVGHNPELLDGYVHYKPAFLVSKSLPEFHDIELASSIGFDVVDGSSEGFKEVDGEMPLDVMTISFGGRKTVMPYSYSLEFVYTTDRQDGGDAESLTMTPGVYYHVPVEKWQWLPGDAVLSAGVRFGVMDAKTYEIVFGFKVDIPIDIKVDVKKREMKVKSEGIKRSYRKIKGLVTGVDESGEEVEIEADEPEENVPAEEEAEPAPEPVPVQQP